MRGQMVEFTTDGRTLSGYLVNAAAGSGPGLIVIQEFWGLVDQIKEVADRFAGDGFVVLAPDLYRGKRSDDPDTARKLAMALDIEDAGESLRGAAEYLLALDAVEPKRVGALGFCMGGQLALFAAAEHGDRIATAVDFYGFHPAVQFDPAKLRVPVLAHFGEGDHVIPVSAARALIERLTAAGTPVEAHFYDAGHAFLDHTRPHVYCAEQASEAWRRTTLFLHAHLAGPSHVSI